MATPLPPTRFSSPDAADSRRRDLHGLWRRSVAGRLLDFVPVPGSYRPLGECELEYEFACPRDWLERPGRFFLCTDGVLTTARFSLNGAPIGLAGPWAPHRFELPPGLLHERNVIQARVRDIVEPVGPVTGRRYDGGLIRDLYLERRPPCHIRDVIFRAALDDGCASASCTVAVELDGAAGAAGRVDLVLAEIDTGRVAASLSAAPGELFRFDVAWPRLWSPDHPQLYRLRVRLSGEAPDECAEAVGFRRIEVRGRDFYLNNQRIVLKGVCRHEFTSASGYSPSDAEVRRELALIKHAGFNYVRLVHSPHGPMAPRIAAELGLLVTEEPGMSWEDLGREEIAALGLETLRRTVLRDRNVPSVFAWMIYNECDPIVSYAVRAAAMCRELDPGRLLSMADCSGRDAAIKGMVDAAGLSYYGINRYGYDPEGYLDRMDVFADRPLVFTEWGGWLALGNPRVMGVLTSTFIRHSRPPEARRIAGCSFWAWADYEEFSRPDPAAIEGWTVEGLLDQRGRPRPELQALSLMCFEIDHPPLRWPGAIAVLTKAPPRPGAWQTVDLSGAAGDSSRLQAALEAMRTYPRDLPAWDRLVVAGIEFDGRAGLLLLGEGREEIVIPVDRPARQVAVLGQVDLAGGYPGPRDSQLGQPASEYEFVFEDGAIVQPLLHGIHILRGNRMTPTGRGWKTSPRAPETSPALEVEVNPGFEILRIDLWERSFSPGGRLREIRWRLRDRRSIQAMLAVSVAAD